jgi:hypothetical protein
MHPIVLELIEPTKFNAISNELRLIAATITKTHKHKEQDKNRNYSSFDYFSVFDNCLY